MKNEIIPRMVDPTLELIESEADNDNNVIVTIKKNGVITGTVKLERFSEESMELHHRVLQKWVDKKLNEVVVAVET